MEPMRIFSRDFAHKEWMRSLWRELFGSRPQATRRNLQRFIERESKPCDCEIVK